MSDFTFMKSGFNQLQETDDLEKEITTLVATFANEGLKHASHYLKHHEERKVILPEDLKRGMMLEVFLFNKRPDLNDKLKEIKEIIYHYDKDEDEDEEDEDEEEDVSENVTYSENKCTCAICKCINSIHQRWENWTPNSGFELILKKSIDEIGI